MTDQLSISDSGEIIAQPLTWDGEPLYSQSTIREGLFDPEAFEQMPGQISMETESCAIHTDALGRPMTCQRSCYTTNGGSSDGHALYVTEPEEFCVICEQSLDDHWLGSCPA